MSLVRVLLALAVLAAHGGGFGVTEMIRGSDAVVVFFVISGFYMALILDTKYSRVSDFYINRILRLWPAYIIVCLAGVILYFIIFLRLGRLPPPEWVPRAIRQMANYQRVLLIFSNITMIGLNIIDQFFWKDGVGFVFNHSDIAGPTPDGYQWGGRLLVIGQAWSIGIEIFFYFVAPFLMRLKSRYLVGIAIVSFVFRWIIGLNSLLSYFSFAANLQFFLLGALGYRNRHALLPPTRFVTLPSALLLMIVCLGGYLPSSLVLDAATALLIPSTFFAYKESRFVRLFGDGSYCIYICHTLVGEVVAIIFRTHNIWIVCCAVLIVSYTIVFFVERPVDRFRQRRHQALSSARDSINRTNSVL